MLQSEQKGFEGYEFPVRYSHKVIGYGIGPQQDSDAKDAFLARLKFLPPNVLLPIDH